MPSRNSWDMMDFPLEFELFQEYAGVGQCILFVSFA